METLIRDASPMHRRQLTIIWKPWKPALSRIVNESCIITFTLFEGNCGLTAVLKMTRQIPACKTIQEIIIKVFENNADMIMSQFVQTVFEKKVQVSFHFSCSCIMYSRTTIIK